VDRTKAALKGASAQRDLATGLLVSLSGSFQTAPTFFPEPKNGVNYSLVTQTPQYDIQSLTDLQKRPGERFRAPRRFVPEILADVSIHYAQQAKWNRVSHYNIRRVVDIYGSVQGRDLGGVSGATSRAS
jgi:multidrug efflux pump subunit AcrB